METPKRAITGRSLIHRTLFYVLIFPILLFIGPASIMVYDNPRITHWQGIPIALLGLSVPLSALITVIAIWILFTRQKYNQALKMSLIPVYVFALWVIVSTLLTLPYT